MHGRLRRAYRFAHRMVLRELPPGELSEDAIVFAPHPDDETLGCGATIIQKRRLGARVQVVFMTDGSNSHPELMEASGLARLRVEEAQAAAEVLGLETGDLTFLGHPDGSLAEHEEAAVSAVARILQGAPRAGLYVTFGRDGTSDHEAAYRIVAGAIRADGRPRLLYQFPIWYWNRWPWVRRPDGYGGRSELVRVASGIVAGARLVVTFRRRVGTGEHLAAKRAAVSAYRSQFSSLEPGWPNLADFGEGQFLDCFLQPYEIFRRERR